MKTNYEQIKNLENEIANENAMLKRLATLTAKSNNKLSSLVYRKANLHLLDENLSAVDRLFYLETIEAVTTKLQSF